MGAGQQQVSLSGIAAGAGEIQPLEITAAADDPGLVTGLSVNYISPQSTGTLQYTPA